MSVEIIHIDEQNFSEWVEMEVAIDGERCLPFQVTRRTWQELRNNEPKLFDFLYKFGKSVTEKCGNYRNPFPSHTIEGGIAA